MNQTLDECSWLYNHYLSNARATLVTSDDYHLRDISDKAAIG
jgi:hypothetical protein